MDEVWERILTVGDYYDGPRSGIATHHGKPHVFECQFSEEKDDYTDLFLLMEIDETLLQLAVEQWDIYLRWNSAFRNGEVTLDYKLPLALPEDRKRYKELAELIGDRLTPVAGQSILVRGEFQRTGSRRDNFSVRWHDLMAAPPPSP